MLIFFALLFPLRGSLLLQNHFCGLCAFVWFRHRQKCVLRFVMELLHISSTSRLSMKGSHKKSFFKMCRRTKKFEKPWYKVCKKLVSVYVVRFIRARQKRAVRIVLKNRQLHTLVSRESTPAMSNPNRLLSQKSCHYLSQGRTLNNVSMRAAHWMPYFDLSKPNLVKANVLKAFES